jgi:single-strand DNA-binding protein
VNEIRVDLQGNVATKPTLRTTPTGRLVTSFRLAATPRRFDAELGWQDLPTSWLTVSCWNGLAENAAICLAVGDPVLVVGRLRVRDWERDGRRGQEVEVEALGLGHDLHRGVTVFRKVAPRRRPDEAAVDPTAADASGGAEPRASVGVDPGDEPLDPFDPDTPSRPAEPDGPAGPAAPADDLADPFAAGEEDGDLETDPGAGVLAEPVGSVGRGR